MTAPDELRPLLGTPRTRPPAVDWSRISAETGLAFPSDYKAFAETYPALYIDEFITIFHPGMSDDTLNIVTASGEYLDAIRELSDVAPGSVPYPVHPEPGGIYPWGVTSNGDWLFWRTTGDPDSWPIVGTDGGAEWVEFDGTMTEFLVATLSRTTRFELFPDAYPRPGYSIHEYEN